MKILVVGAGPAGAFFAIQMRKMAPSAEIRIVERNPEGAAYGFGLALQAHVVPKLMKINPALFERISAEFHIMQGQDIILGDTCVPIDRNMMLSAGAFKRTTLLQVLADYAKDCGLTIEYETQIDPADGFDGYDLVVAADGGNSRIRDYHADAFGTMKSELENRFAWYGSRAPFSAPGLAFRKVGESVFVAHYYQHCANMSSFVAECDGATWEKHGFGDLTDSERKAVFEEVFAPELGGEELVESRSIWRRWPICENKHWVHENVVLIGDARHAAHPTIGSGTRIAFDDGHALATALTSVEGSLADKLRSFEEARRATVQKLASAMVNSYTWYEEVRQHMEMHPLDFTHNFMTRTGRLNDDRLRAIAPEFMAAYEAHKAGANGLGNQPQKREFKNDKTKTNNR
ncbi:MAG: FAD-dependent monooxygenase [Chloroflexota bacterium]